ncbi:helix-turn-helix domain-containing protein [Streptomyces sp. NRAIS4]
MTRYTRQRAECIRLLDRGRTAPEVAEVLDCHVTTVGYLAGLSYANRRAARRHF